MLKEKQAESGNDKADVGHITFDEQSGDIINPIVIYAAGRNQFFGKEDGGKYVILLIAPINL